MRKTYIGIRIPTALDAGEILSLMDEPQCLGACEQDGAVYLYWAQDAWQVGMRHRLQAALRSLGDATAADTLLTIELPDQDWNLRWAESLQPIRLGPRIWVRQSWNSVSLRDGEIELVIDPKRAFGTGYHATTQLIAEWLPEKVRGGERILDVGTGSGILAMVALRLGARTAVAIDIDPEAIECAREYAAVNGFLGELTLRAAALEDLDAERADILVANLDRPTLSRYFPRLHRHVKDSGTLLVSGLLIEDQAEIAAALEAGGWREAARREREEWMALELRPRGNSAA